MGRKQILDLEVILVKRTDKAVLVTSYEGAEPVWLPLSQIEIDDDAFGVTEIVIPAWLAQEKELI